MLRTILKSERNSLMLELPDDLVGRTIEVIAFSVDDDDLVLEKIPSLEMRVAAVKDKLRKFTFNSGGYLFNRDEANDYE